MKKPLLLSHSPRQRGFNIPELLAVLVIGTILLLLSLAAIQRINHAGKATKCLANLRQVTAALLAWTAENRGRFPFCVEDNENGVASRNYWAGLLYSSGHVSDHRIFFCPRQKDLYYLDSHRREKWKSPHSAEWAYIGYGINRMGIAPRKRWPSNFTAQLSQIRNAPDILLLAETNADTQIRDGWYYFVGNAVLQGLAATIEPRHQGYTNVAFVDGHLERVSLDDLRRRSSDPRQPPWVEGVYAR